MRYGGALFPPTEVISAVFGCLVQPPLGAARQFLVIIDDPQHHFLGLFVGHLFGMDTRLLGTLAPVFRIIDGDFGHGCKLPSRLLRGRYGRRPKSNPATAKFKSANGFASQPVPEAT